MNNSIAMVSSQKGTITEEEMQVLKDSFFKGFTGPEISFSMAVANKIGLSPLLRQIHFVKRNGTVVPQTAIDGLRLIAERTGKYAGSDEAVYEYEGDNRKQPAKATVTVHKLLDGQRVPFTASARWAEFFPGGNQGFMWNKLPHIMLAKCAEAQALRKAFPAEMSGVYADEEMQQADRPTEKAKRIQDIIMKDAPKEVAPAPSVDATAVTEEILDFDNFKEVSQETNVVSLGDFVLPACAKKYAGQRLSEVNKEEFCQYIVDIRNWFETEKKKVSPAWKEVFANVESYFG